VRWATLPFGNRDAKHDIILPDFPVPNTDYKSLYLSPDGLLSDYPVDSEGKASHNSEDRSSLSSFKYTFTKPTRLLGIPKAEIFMSCDDLDDMIVFIQLRKLDENGKELSQIQFPLDRAPVNSIEEMAEKDRVSLTLHNGSIGILRASQRKIDASKSLHPQFPFHPHDEVQKVPQGEVIKLEVGIWAMGVDYEAGESIRVDILGQYPGWTEVALFSKPRPDYEKNKGTHIVHYGGMYPSRVILPFVDI
jgi:predicted acyl esterase